MKLVTVQGSMQLATPAAIAWARLVDDAREHTGVTLTISSPGGAYRDADMVLDMWRNPRKYGATKGTAKPSSLGGPGSVHENGLCVDIWNWAELGTKRLDELAARHGFHRTLLLEPWHYQHSGISPAALDPDPEPEPISTPPSRKEHAVLYHKADTTPTLYALAGESPGTPANWLETTDQSVLANGWSRQLGNVASIGLNAATWEAYKADYLAPVRVTS